MPHLTAFLNERIHGADSGEVSAKVEQSKYRPSKKLLDHVARLIKGKPEYVLLDEQLVVYDKVVEAAMGGVKGRKGCHYRARRPWHREIGHCHELAR